MSNSTLPDKDSTGKDLSGQDFSGLDLSGYIFRSCKLNGTNFSACKFDDKTIFEGASFGKSGDKVTSFSGCDLRAAKFSVPADFGKLADRKSPVNLANATIPWTLLGNTIRFVDITGAVFTGMPSSLEKYNFEGVKWNNADLAGVSVFNASFKFCNLTGSKFNGSDTQYAKFLNSDLTGVKMNGNAFFRTIFDGCTMTDTDLSYATSFGECSFLNTYLNGTIFDGLDLTDSVFGIPNRMSTDPKHITSFQFAKITTDFLMRNVQKNWQCMDLRNVMIDNFSSILPRLTNLQAMNSLFNNSLSFENARLNGANFEHAVFNSVNFTNAQLNNAILANAKTLQGKEAGCRSARFRIPETDTVNYPAFLAALTGNNTAAIIKSCKVFNLPLKTITCTAIPARTEWEIVQTDTTPNRKFQVIKEPLPGVAGKFQLWVYETSPSLFNYAHMVGASMQDCDFSNAQLKHAQLYGAQIIAGILSSVDMTGAQLGNNAAIFSLAQSDTSRPPQYSYAVFLEALTTSSIGSLIELFNENGYALGNATCRVLQPDPGKKASWQIEDNTTDPVTIFAVDQVASATPGNDELRVFCKSISPATLDNSYMPAIVLTQADLTACSAQGCHLYNNEQTGSKAILNQTILLDSNFERANLYNADFTKAILAGASFTKANLMKAKFNGVNFEKSSSGRNISFKDTNLQGADFSLSNFKSVNFLDAAICLPISEAKKEQTYGVSLKRIKKSDPGFDQCIADLAGGAVTITGSTALMSVYYLASKLKAGKIDDDLRSELEEKKVKVPASASLSVLQEETTFFIKDGDIEYQLIPGFDEDSKVVYNVFKKGGRNLFCNLQFGIDLVKGTVSPAFAAAIKAASANKLALSSAATIGDYRRAVLCSITGPDKSWNIWWGVAPDMDDGTMALVVRPVLNALPPVFKTFQVDLRPQSVITKSVTADNVWELDMGTYDAFYQSAGYIKFKIVRTTVGDTDMLNIYGHTMRMMGMGNNQRPRIQDFVCEVTQLAQERTDSDTIFPNHYTKSQNIRAGTPYEQWMWAKNSSPAPPRCVPTPYSFCPVIN